jgi:hypothetical protein
MATPTTSIAAIRDALVTAIKALTPSVTTATTHAGYTFRYAGEMEFSDYREHMESMPDACFRRFVIEWDMSEPVGAWQGGIQRRLVDLAVSVAYPTKAKALFGSENYDLADMIEGDLVQILGVAGPKSTSYPSGSTPVEEGTIEIEPGPTVTFGIARVPAEYYYQT